MPIKLYFGKHKGKTLEWIFFHDPEYIKWIVENGIHKDPFKFTAEGRARLEKLVKRASHLKIPGFCERCGEKPITKMSLVLHTSGGLVGVEFHCEECRPRESYYSTPLNPSLLESDYFRSYNKMGAKILIRAIKGKYFGDSTIRLSQRRLEEFFDNPNNFVNF